MNKATASTEVSAQIERHFGKNASHATRVVEVLTSSPDRVWRVDEIMTAAEIVSIIEGMMTLSRLTYIGVIDHPGLGVYQAARATLSGRDTRRAS